MKRMLVDCVVVGGGAAGLSAADAAARLGVGVLLVEEGPRLGGRLPAQLSQAGPPARRWNGRRASEELIARAASSGAVRWTSTEVWGLKGNLAPATEGGCRSRDYPWEVLVRRAGHGVGSVESKAVLVATGAKQEPLVFPGWTMPGVVTAGAILEMVHVHQVFPGARGVIVGVDPLAMAVLESLSLSGVGVQAVVLPPANSLNGLNASPQHALAELVRLSRLAPTPWIRAVGALARHIPSEVLSRVYPEAGLRVWGAAVRAKTGVVEVRGKGNALRVITSPSRVHFSGALRRERVYDVDFVCTSGGLSPLCELTQAAGCLHTRAAGGSLVPLYGPDHSTTEPGLFVAGSVGGVEAAPVAVAQGRAAAVGIARHLGFIDEAKASQMLRNAQQDVKRARRLALIEFTSGSGPGVAGLVNADQLQCSHL